MIPWQYDHLNLTTNRHTWKGENSQPPPKEQSFLWRSSLLGYLGPSAQLWNWLTPPELETCPRVWLIYSVSLLWGVQCSLSQWTATANCILVMGEILCSLLFLCTGILSDLNQCLSREYWYSLSIPICIGPVVSGKYCFLRVIHQLQILRSSHLLFHIDLWDLREGCDKGIIIRAERSMDCHYVLSGSDCFS